MAGPHGHFKVKFAVFLWNGRSSAGWNRWNRLRGSFNHGVVIRPFLSMNHPPPTLARLIQAAQAAGGRLGTLPQESYPLAVFPVAVGMWMSPFPHIPPHPPQTPQVKSRTSLAWPTFVCVLVPSHGIMSDADACPDSGVQGPARFSILYISLSAATQAPHASRHVASPFVLASS